MTRPAIGLVVGKFAPLHRGHQFLLDRAQSMCERLVILSYAKPERDGCAPESRASWLASIYPEARIVVLDDARLASLCHDHHVAARHVPHDDENDDVHRHFVAWVLRELLHERVDVVFTSEDYGEGFAGVLSAEQGFNPRVAHVLVDPARSHVPISATRIREDVHAHRAWLDPVVYSSFVQRIALLGGESTGKTTLANALAERLGTTWVPEYGRDLWEQRAGQLAFDDMLHIAETQLSREAECIRHANRYVFCDTTALTTLLYSEALFARSDSRLEALARRRYDHTFLCSADFEFVQDGTRQTREFQGQQQMWYLKRLTDAGTEFSLITGSVEERVAKILGFLQVSEGG